MNDSLLLVQLLGIGFCRRQNLRDVRMMRSMSRYNVVRQLMGNHWIPEIHGFHRVPRRANRSTFSFYTLVEIVQVEEQTSTQVKGHRSTVTVNVNVE